MARSHFIPGEYIVWGTVRIDPARSVGGRSLHYLECHGSRNVATGMATTGSYFRPKNIERYIRQGTVELGKSYRFDLTRSSIYSCWINKVNGEGNNNSERSEAEQAKQAAKQSAEVRQSEGERWKAEQATKIAEMFEVPIELLASEIAETVESITYAPLADPEPATESSLVKLLNYMQARNHHGHHLNLMLVGPAGCGKSTIARMAAEVVQRPFYFTSFSRDTPPWELTGRAMPGHDGEWTYQPSEFVKAYSTGGVWLGDEFDAADANTLLVLNAALANGHMVIPGHETVSRHRDFVAIAAANTHGSGSRVYVGREEVDYDRAYEGNLLAASDSGAQVGQVITAIRSVIDGTAGEKPLRRTCSTRRIIDWTAAIGVGRDLGELLEEYFASWSTVDRQKAKSNAAVRSAMSSRIAPAAAPAAPARRSYHANTTPTNPYRYRSAL
jgi:hypothetical protein